MPILQEGKERCLVPARMQIAAQIQFFDNAETQDPFPPAQKAVLPFLFTF